MKKNKSAIKKARQSEEKKIRNSHVKSTMKTHIKRVMVAIENKTVDNFDGILKSATSYIQKAASKGVIHKNSAARKVSRLTKKGNSLSHP